MNLNDYKNIFEKKREFKVKVKKIEVPSLKNSYFTTASKVGAGIALAPAVPVELAGVIAEGVVGTVGNIVDVVGFGLALPSALLAAGAFSAGGNLYNPVAKAALYTGGAIAAIPTAAILITTGIASGIIKLGAGLIGCLTLAATAPFKLIAKGVLKAGKRNSLYDALIEVQEREENIIEGEFEEVDEDIENELD